VESQRKGSRGKDKEREGLERRAREDAWEHMEGKGGRCEKGGVGRMRGWRKEV